MKLNMHIILQNMRDICVNFHILSNYLLTIESVLFFEPNKAPDKTCVYLTTAADFCHHSEKRPPALIFYGSSPEELQNLQFQNIDYIFVREDIGAFQLMNYIQSIFRLYDNWECRLKTAIIQGATYQEILDIGHEMLFNPVALLSSVHVLIAMSGETANAMESSPWSDLKNLGYLTPERIIYGLKHDIDEITRNNEHRLVTFPHGLTPYSTVQAYVFKGTSLVSYLVQQDLVCPFSDVEKSILFYLSLIFKNLAQGKSEAVFGKNENILDHILCKKPLPIDLVRYSFQALHFNVDKPMILFAFRTDNENSHHLYSQLCSIVDLHLRDGHVACYAENNLVILFEYNDTDDIGTWLEPFLRGMNIIAGCSVPFCGIQGITDAFLQAKRTRDSGACVHRGAHVYCSQDGFLNAFYEDIGPQQFKSVTENFDIMTLRAYDVAHNTEYVKSLYYYLLHGTNIAQTAAALHVHRNTLVYRISRIQEIIHLDISNESRTILLLLSAGYHFREL